MVLELGVMGWASLRKFEEAQPLAHLQPAEPQSRTSVTLLKWQVGRIHPKDQLVVLFVMVEEFRRNLGRMQRSITDPTMCISRLLGGELSCDQAPLLFAMTLELTAD
jgi:hypothetical protein